MASTSSTRKAAKLAQKGKGRKVRFQGGTVFPLAVAATLVLGLAAIVYSRQTLPAADESEPTVNQHWHAAYGFNICGEWYQLSGNLEELNASGQLVNQNFLRTGIHSHDDGVMHWHPYTSRAVGKNAVLGVFLETYEVELTNDTLKIPANQTIGFADEYIEGETQCNGEDAELAVKAWSSYTDTDGGKRYIAEMDRIHLDNDNMVFAIYFAPRTAEQTMPPWALQLPDLGAVDSAQIRPEDLIETDPTVSGENVSTDAETSAESTAAESTAAESTAAESTATEASASETAATAP